jgi:hypothetical protein
MKILPGSFWRRRATELRAPDALVDDRIVRRQHLAQPRFDVARAPFSRRVGSDDGNDEIVLDPLLAQRSRQQRQLAVIEKRAIAVTVNAEDRGRMGRRGAKPYHADSLLIHRVGRL